MPLASYWSCPWNERPKSSSNPAQRFWQSFCPSKCRRCSPGCRRDRNFGRPSQWSSRHPWPNCNSHKRHRLPVYRREQTERISTGHRQCWARWAERTSSTDLVNDNVSCPARRRSLARSAATQIVHHDLCTSRGEQQRVLSSQTSASTCYDRHTSIESKLVSLRHFFYENTKWWPTVDPKIKMQERYRWKSAQPNESANNLRSIAAFI